MWVQDADCIYYFRNACWVPGQCWHGDRRWRGFKKEVIGEWGFLGGSRLESACCHAEPPGPYLWASHLWETCQVLRKSLTSWMAFRVSRAGRGQGLWWVWQRFCRSCWGKVAERQVLDHAEKFAGVKRRHCPCDSWSCGQGRDGEKLRQRGSPGQFEVSDAVWEMHELGSMQGTKSYDLCVLLVHSQCWPVVVAHNV